MHKKFNWYIYFLGFWKLRWVLRPVDFWEMPFYIWFLMLWWPHREAGTILDMDTVTAMDILMEMGKVGSIKAF